jgi:hypothetical protein
MDPLQKYDNFTVDALRFRASGVPEWIPRWKNSCGVRNQDFYLREERSAMKEVTSYRQMSKYRR